MDASELKRIRASLCKARPGMSLGLGLAVGFGFVVQGIVNIKFRHDGVFVGLGVCQVILGLCCVPLIRFGQLTNLVFGEPGREIDLKIDDFGLTVADPDVRIPWSSVSAIRDLGEAFFVVRRSGRGIPILKRALPDGGAGLWELLDAKLTAKRYLIRGSDSQLTITNSALQH